MAQNGQLTLVFENYRDLMMSSKDMILGLTYLLDKYEHQEGVILCVLKIDALKEQVQ